MLTSEQVPSSVGVGVLLILIIDSCCWWFIIQFMPGIEDETITEIEERLKTIPPISKMIQQGFTPEQILEEVLGEGNVRLLEKMPVQFKCDMFK